MRARERGGMEGRREAMQGGVRVEVEESRDGGLRGGNGSKVEGCVREESRASRM